MFGASLTARNVVPGANTRTVRVYRPIQQRTSSHTPQHMEPAATQSTINRRLKVSLPKATLPDLQLVVDPHRGWHRPRDDMLRYLLEVEAGDRAAEADDAVFVLAEHPLNLRVRRMLDRRAGR